MKDNYGDRVTVTVAPCYGPDAVSLILEDFEGEVEHVYTPAKARKLARKLLKVADEAERTSAGRGTSSVAADAPETSSASLPDTQVSSVEAGAE